MTNSLKHLLSVSILLLFCIGCSSTTLPKKENTKTITSKQISLSSDLRDEIILYSLGLLNIQYQWGGKKPDFGLDCSGLVSYVYANAVNIKLPGKASLQAEYGREVDLATIKPGDLLFFNTTGKSYSHVGIYIGENKFIHAPKTGDVVKVSKLEKYYKQKFQKAVTFFS